MIIPDCFIAEHTELRAKVKRLRATASAGQPADLAEQLAGLQEEVRRHFRHEDVFYRILDGDKRIPDRGAMHQIRNDHAAIIFGLESLAIRLRKNGPTAEWQVKIEKLLLVLLPHFDQEESKIFPEALKLLTPAEIEAIQGELSRSE